MTLTHTAHSKVWPVMHMPLSHFVVMEMTMVRMMWMMRMFPVVLRMGDYAIGLEIICSKMVWMVGMLFVLRCDGFCIAGAKSTAFAALKIVNVTMVGAARTFIGIIHITSLLKDRAFCVCVRGDGDPWDSFVPSGSTVFAAGNAVALFLRPSAPQMDRQLLLRLTAAEETVLPR